MLFNISTNPTQACALQQQALRLRQHYEQAADRRPFTLYLLVVMKKGFVLDKTYIDYLIEGSSITCDVLYVGDDLPLPVALRAHDAAFVAIALFARNHSLIDRVRTLRCTTSAPC